MDVLMYIPAAEFNRAFRWDDEKTSWKARLMLEKLPFGTSDWGDENVEYTAEALGGFYTTDGKKAR
jgi:hypothetical protein